ncbi:unnamed protein product [Rotaria sp. Silwood1]|nr:unnamed protein product [Rotaria sp. Silwood1]CAF5034052.1 unnamed protein product [Rotaria sp. Silwood1]
MVLYLDPNGGEVTKILANSYHIKLSSKQTDGEFTMMEGIVLSGEGLHLLTPKGSCVYASRGVVHTFRNINGINARPAQLQFWSSPAGIENYFQQVSYALNQKPPDLDLVMKIAKEWGIDIIGSPNWSIAG